MSQENESRIADLEAALAHQQHAYDGLNEVVIDQAKRIERNERRLAKLESMLDNLQTQLPAEPRDSADEKPPHY